MWRDHKKESLNKSVRFPKVEGKEEPRWLHGAEKPAESRRDPGWIPRADTAPYPWAGILDKRVSHLPPQDPVTASGVRLNFGGCYIFDTHLLKSWGEAAHGQYTHPILSSPLIPNLQ